MSTDVSQEDVHASRWAQAFEAVLRKILEDYEGTEVKVRDGMEAGMRKLFAQPYKEELSQANDALTVEEAQRVFFFPTLSDARRYAEVFRRVTPENTARREQVMKFKMMSVFYTLHRKDGALVDRFMQCGGLCALAELLGEDHRVIQSQVIELLLEMLSPIMPQLELPATSSVRQKHLHHEVYVCLRSKPFWKNVSRIVDEPYEVFPKSHANCIRILAGAIGWLRPPDAAPGGVRPEAGITLDTANAQTALQHFLESDVYRASPPDIRGIAEDLLAELSQGPISRQDPLPRAEVAFAQESIFSAEAVAREDASHAWQSMRQLGNDAFKKGLIWPAEAAYRLALLDGGSAVPALEASLIESNRALVLLKAGHAADAADAAEAALVKNPRNAKAAFRRATALLELASPGAPSAATHAAGAVVAANLAAELEPDDVKVAELRDRIRRRAEELGPSQEVNEEVLDVMD